MVRKTTVLVRAFQELQSRTVEQRTQVGDVMVAPLLPSTRSPQDIFTAVMSMVQIVCQEGCDTLSASLSLSLYYSRQHRQRLIEVPSVDVSVIMRKVIACLYLRCAVFDVCVNLFPLSIIYFRTVIFLFILHFFLNKLMFFNVISLASLLKLKR